MKQLLLLSLFAMFWLAQGVQAQGGLPLPFSTDFDSGIQGWEVLATEGAEWVPSTMFGVNGSGSAIVDKGGESDPSSGWLITPALDLTTAKNPVLTFTTALVTNNFLAPVISLWYDDGSGWKKFDNWGVNEFYATNVVEGSHNYMRLLNPENIQLNEVSVDLSSLAEEENIRFYFSADMLNGGWIIVDNVSFSSASISSVAENVPITPRHFPNPVKDILSFESDQSVESLIVYDLLGRNLLEVDVEGGSTTTVDLSSLPTGEYWLQLRDRKNQQVNRFSILKE
ncbi:MAG: T9SS type A sorting domain-containing protein [Candidatus Kapaibacterium sp.]